MNRNSKVMSIVAVVVGVAALTIGFAAFSNTLTIQSGATVKPNESDFKVEFSTRQDSVVYGTITPDTPSEEFPATGATITVKEGETALSGLTANFTGPGDVVYEIFMHNTGKYKAYLNGVNFKNILNENVKKKCTTKSGEDNPLVNKACDGISIEVSLQGPIVTDSRITGSLDNTNINSFLYLDDSTFNYLEPNAAQGQSVLIWIKYGSYDLADEEFTVEFGDIEFLFESVD